MMGFAYNRHLQGHLELYEQDNRRSGWYVRSGERKSPEGPAQGPDLGVRPRTLQEVNPGEQM